MQNPFLELVAMSQIPHFLAIIKLFECLPYCNYSNTQPTTTCHPHQIPSEILYASFISVTTLTSPKKTREKVTIMCSHTIDRKYTYGQCYVLMYYYKI